MNEVYVSYNGTLYVPYIAVYMFHGYTGTLYVAYMNALPEFAAFRSGFDAKYSRNIGRKLISDRDA